MTTLTPLQSLCEPQTEEGVSMPLPAELDSLYGPLQFPLHAGLPYVIANFVSTLDGVVSLEIPGHAGGGEISGFNLHDRLVMGMLRAVADAVIVGAGTLRAVAADHLWTAAYIFPALAGAYQQLRTALGKPESPLNVIVSASGKVDLSQRVFQSGEVSALIVTTLQGQKRLQQQPLPPSVQVVAVKSESSGEISARAVLEAVGSLRPSSVILVEGGPQLMGNFLAEKCLDELFLTFAPQVAGREKPDERPGFVTGKKFAPEQPLWGALTGAKRAGSHLFLRYTFKKSSS
jgi:riboflavin biosynthesis pyrimidine reductase